MLQQLSVRNLALIDTLELEPGEGLVAFTGETGAGKSVIFNAIGLLMGERASADVIRHGCDEGSVRGVFYPDGSVVPVLRAKLEEAGIPFTEELIVRRVLSRSGRHRAWLNDAPVTIAFLAEVVGLLMEVVGQHQHLSLVREDEQRRMIDRWARPGDLADSMAADYAAWKSAVRERKALEEARADRVQRLEFLRFQRDEISALGLREGEFEALETKLQRVRYAEKIREGNHKAQSLLYALDSSAVGRIADAIGELQKLVNYDESYASFVERLVEAQEIVTDVSRELDRGGFDDDTRELDALETRHQQLKTAMRRFALDEPGMIARLEELNEEINRLENLTERLDAMEAVEAAALKKAQATADVLDEVRREAAADLFERVSVELGRLAMEGSQLALAPADKKTNPALTAHGWDSIRIYFSANAGEQARPIGKVASGGELSRLLLALKRVMMERDPIPTCLFDEVDTGIGGQAAVAVGQMLREVAASRQILCITHLAQIASRAHHQFLVAKHVEEGRTVSTIRELDVSEREREIARMLGGAPDTDASLAHARAMLAS